MGYGAAIGAIAAALIGGGAQVGGGALAADEAKGKERTSTQLPSSNLANQIATLALLSRLGYAPPTQELLLQSSPIQQALNRRFATPVSRESRRRLLDVSQFATETMIAARAAGDTRSAEEILFETGLTKGGKSHAALERIAQDGGFRSLSEMLDTEIEYRNKIPEIMQRQEQGTAQQRQLQDLATGQQIAALQSLASVSDVATQRDLERTRLLRDIGLQESNVLAAANAGGYNPAGGLEALARLRTDADVEALNRAIARATGETAIATQRGNVAKALDPSLIALGLAPINAAGGTTSNTASPGGSGLLGQSVANAGAVTSAGILEALDLYSRRSQAPAGTSYSQYQPRTGDSLTNYGRGF